MRRTPRLLTAGAALVVAAGVAGCTAFSEVDPRVQLREAATRTASQQVLSYEVSLAGEREEVERFLAANVEPGAEPVSSDDLDRLLSTSLVVTHDRGASRASADDDAKGLRLRMGDRDVLEVRSLGDELYVRVDTDTLEEEVGGLSAAIDEVRTQLDADPELDQLRPLLDGEWVLAPAGDGSALARLLEERASGGPAPGTRPAPGAGPAPLFEALSSVLEGADVERAGQDDVGERLQATLSARSAYEELRPALLGLASAHGSRALPEPSQVPDRPVRLDLWVKGDVLTALELDLSQFTRASRERLALRVDVESGGSVSAPAGAAELDVAELEEALSGADDASNEAVVAAEALDREVTSLAGFEDAAPSLEHLEVARPDFEALGIAAEVVQGRVEVTTSGGDVACLALGTGLGQEGTVTPGAC